MGLVKDYYFDVITSHDNDSLPPDFVPAKVDLFEMDRVHSLQSIRQQVEVTFPQSLFPSEFQQLNSAIDLLDTMLSNPAGVAHA